MRYDPATANAIEATGLVKRFGKTAALGGVDLVARPGRGLGVLGPNGGGKPVTGLWHGCGRSENQTFFGCAAASGGALQVSF